MPCSSFSFLAARSLACLPARFVICSAHKRGSRETHTSAEGEKEKDLADITKARPLNRLLHGGSRAAEFAFAREHQPRPDRRARKQTDRQTVVAAAADMSQQTSAPADVDSRLAGQRQH